VSSSQRPSVRTDPHGVRRPRNVRPGPRVRFMQFINSGRIASALLLIVVAYWATQMVWSDQYTVRRVLVSGANILNEQRINEMIAIDGLSIWAVNPDVIESTLQASPYVASVSVQVQLPDTVQIMLYEQQSELRWKSGEWHLIVDDAGAIVGIDTAVVLTNTLVINDDSGQPLSEGDMLDVAILNMAKTVYLRLPVEANLQIERVGWDPRRGLTINTTANQLILFGGAERIDSKIQILHELQLRGAEYVFADVRSQTPYYRTDIPPQALLATIEVLTDTAVLTDTTTIAGTDEDIQP
jgi:cell division protein FtsQ